MAKSISRYLADISSTSGVLDGTLSTAAQTNITSLGTLSSLTVSGSAAMTLTTAAQPNITSVGTLSSLSTSGNISITGSNNELRLYEGANYVGFEAPALSADKIWVLPAADGSSGQALITDGSGNLSFAAGGKSTEEIQDIVGAMFTSNTETRGALTYQDGDGTIDLVVDDMTAVTTINNNANNKVITGSGTANTLEAEGNLTFDGTTLALAQAYLSHPTTYTYQTLKVQNDGGDQVCIDLHRDNGTKVGTFYGNTSHEQGFLSSTYGWVFKVDNSGNVMPTGYIGLGGPASPSNNCQLSHPSTSTWQTLKIKNADDSSQCAIEQHSSQDTKRCIVYGATDYYGFLTQSAGWSWKGDSSGNWTATANITAYSDIRLKEKVITIPNALEKVTKLRGVEYTRISTQEREIGVIAQEVKEIVPELVTITDGRTEADPDALQDLHTMKYQNTVGLLIEAIKELKAEVDELKGNK